MNHFQYLTINEKGCFVGGKSTKYYRGDLISSSDLLPTVFRRLQFIKAMDGIDIKEIRFLASETEYKNVRTGAIISPSGKNPGQNAWYCYVLSDGTVTKWRFYGSYAKYGISCAMWGPAACLFNLSGYSLADISNYNTEQNSPLTKIKNFFTRQK